jgi:4-hydroxy-tetrahydrodipicolinate reductase
MTSPLRVGVLGAGGRMGRAVCQAVHDDPELDLVAAVDPSSAGSSLPELLGVERRDGPSVVVSADAGALIDARVDVAVDFTSPAVVERNVRWCLERGVHVVVGTTGMAPAVVEELREQCRLGGANVALVPNFAIGAVLMARFSELAAPWFDTVEIVELHHDQKVDAPSGTALATAARINSASADWAPDPTRQEVLPGARGGSGPGGIRIHSVRLRGLVAHQEVLFGAPGQTLTIRHDSLDRTSFMPGVLLAVKRVSSHPGLTEGLEPFLGL